MIINELMSMQNRKALCVGIEDYPTAPLYGCADDASRFATMIGHHCVNKMERNFDVLSETKIQNKAQLRKLIKELFKGYYEIALFYYSGHAFFLDGTGYILAPDYQEDDEGISMDEILGYANRSKSIDKVIILDCCNSGAFGSPPDTDGTMANLGQGVTILTASNEKDPAFQINGRGIFTSLLLDAFNGGAADLFGYVTPGSIYAYIDRALGTWAKQRPIFKTNVSRFTILRKVEPQVPLEVIKLLAIYFSSPKAIHKMDPSYEFTNAPPNPRRIKPYADPENVKVMKDLQKLQSIGLVVPHKASYMYFAAMETKGCKLTILGMHYWKMVKEKMQ